MNNGNDAQIEIIGDWNHSISSLMTCLFHAADMMRIPAEQLFLIVFMVWIVLYEYGDAGKYKSHVLLNGNSILNDDSRSVLLDSEIRVRCSCVRQHHVSFYHAMFSVSTGIIVRTRLNAILTVFHSGAGFGSGFGMSGILSAVFKTRVACHSFPCSETRSCSLIAFASRRRSIITVLLGLICIQWIQIKMEPVFLGWGTRALIPTSHFV